MDALALDLGELSGTRRGPAEAGGRFLDRLQGDFARGEARRAMEDLLSGLLLLRSLTPPERWRHFAREEALAHPLRRLVHQDPLSRRSFEKPRGYPGDAPLLGFIYGIERPSDADGPSGQVCEYAVDRPAARAVREASLSRAMRAGEVGELYAVDGDRASLDEVERDFDGANVYLVHASVRRLLARPPEWGAFDLVYSAGLHDYLPRRTAKLLTSWMFERLAPGGRMVFTNSLPSVPDSGYMESYMGWELIYRDLEELSELTSELPPEEVADQRVFQDSEESIGYLVLDRS